MNEQIPSLYQLLKQLQQVPYLASKNIYRVAAHFLMMDEGKVEQFCTIIKEAKKNIQRCACCFTWVERDRNCMFCSSARRNHALICVVETWQELITIEKTGGYQGVYHILGGAISPLDGIGPEDLTLEQLFVRVTPQTEEIILATNQTPEGEATAAYIAGKLKDKKLKISCLARGIPVGSSLEFMDRLTIYKALSERRPF
jgi:recombination protein RecR